MKKQKFLALLLVAALTLSLGATAFAAEEPAPVTATTAGKTTINVTSTLKLPAIEVTIATPTGIIVNPYGMEVELPNMDPTTDTLISTPRLITNSSNIKMKITAEPTASVADGSTVRISTVPVKELEGNAVHMTLSMSNTTDKGYVLDYEGKDASKFTNTSSAIFTNKTAADHNSCSITLPASQGKNYEGFGVYLITGESKGTDWKPTLDVVEVQLVFDIQPDLTVAAP